MGYESRIYIVDKGSHVDPEYDKRYAQILMVFNLGKITVDLEEWYREQKPTDCYIYKDDGNTVILEDEYGDPLREMDLIDLFYALRAEIDRREKQGVVHDIEGILVYGVLGRLMDTYDYRDDRIKCLHYGY